MKNEGGIVFDHADIERRHNFVGSLTGYGTDHGRAHLGSDEPYSITYPEAKLLREPIADNDPILALKVPQAFLL